MKKDLSLPFWEKSSGNALTHVSGLTKEHLAQLAELKEGDRLIIFKNEKRGDTSPQYSLRRFNPPPRDGGEGGL